MCVCECVTRRGQGSSARREANQKIREHAMWECERGQATQVRCELRARPAPRPVRAPRLRLRPALRCGECSRSAALRPTGGPLPARWKSSLSCSFGALARLRAGVHGRVPVRQVQAAQVHLFPDADPLRRRAHDHLRLLRHARLRQPLEVLLSGEGHDGWAQMPSVQPARAGWHRSPRSAAPKFFLAVPLQPGATQRAKCCGVPRSAPRAGPSARLARP